MYSALILVSLLAALVVFGGCRGSSPTPELSIAAGEETLGNDALAPNAEFAEDRLLAWMIPEAFDIDLAPMLPFPGTLAHESSRIIAMLGRGGAKERWLLRQIPGRFEALVDIDRVYVVEHVEGSRSPEDLGILAVSREGRHLAFPRRSAGAWQLVLAESVAPSREDDREDVFAIVAECADRFAFIDWPALSGDGQRVACWAVVSESPIASCVVLFERHGDALVAGHRFEQGFIKAVPIFNPGGDRLAFRAILRNGQEAVCLDGKMGPAYDCVGSPVFSLDGKHVAYRARRAGLDYLVTDGREIGPFDQAGSPFFLASDRLGFVAREGRAVWWKVEPLN